MPNRRRTARKLKRAINKAKIKVKRTQQPTDTAKNPNVDMMKLMALLAANGNGGNKSMDVSSWLNTKEEISKLQHENMKTKDAHKQEIANEKLKRQQLQNEMDVKNQELELLRQRHKTDKAQRDLEHRSKMNALQAQEQNLQGEAAQKQDELADAEDQLEENKKRYDIHKSERLVRELSIKIQRAKMDPNFAKLSRESVEKYIAATERLGEIVDKLNKHEEMLITLNDQQLIEEHLDKAIENMKDVDIALTREIQKNKFELGQVNANIQRKEGYVNSYRGLEFDNKALLRELEVAKSRESNADLIHEVDLEGNVIKTQQDYKRKDVIEPKDDPEVIKNKEIMDSIIDSLKRSASFGYNDKRKWLEIMKLPDQMNDEQSKLWQEGLKKYTKKGKNVYIKHANPKRGLLTLDQVSRIYQEAEANYSKAMESATKKYNEAVEYNERIDALPRDRTFKVDQRMLAAKQDENSQLRDKIDQLNQRAEIKRGLTKEFIKASHDAKMLEEQIKVKGSGATDEDYEKLAKANQKLEEVQRAMNVKDADIKRLQQMQDETKNIEHQTNQINKRIEENPEQKQKREDEMKRQIEARIKAEHEKELAELKAMTYNYERDERIAQYEDNARRSESIRATRANIANEKAKHIAKEEKLKLQEKLRQEERANDELQSTMDAMKLVNGSNKGYKAYDTMIGQLRASNSRMRKGIAATERGIDEYEKNIDHVVNKTFSDPLVQNTIVDFQKRRGRPVPESPEQFRDALDDTDVRALNSLFNQPGFDKKVNERYGIPTPPRPKTPPGGGFMRFYAPDRFVSNLSEGTGDDDEQE